MQVGLPSTIMLQAHVKGATMHEEYRSLQEEKECQDAPKTQHHLQTLNTALWDDSTTDENDIDTIAQPETTIAGQSCGCKHVVAPKLPHASQKLNQTSKEQGEGDCDVGSGRLGPHSVGALQQTRHDVSGKPQNSQRDARALSYVCCGEAFA